MSDLIDRDTAINALEELCDRVCAYGEKHRSVMCVSCPLGSAFDVLENLSTPQPDCISRQAAIDALGKRPGLAGKSEWEIAARKQYDDDRAAIESVPSAQPEQKTGRWIPVTERLPDTYRMVLVCNDDRKIAVAQYVGDDGFWPWKIAYCPYDVDVWDDSENGPVMAWMPLPEPYREECGDE